MFRLIALMTLFCVSLSAEAGVKVLECPYSDSDGKSGVLQIRMDDASPKAEVVEATIFGDKTVLYDKEVLPSAIRLTLTWRSGRLVTSRIIEIDRQTLTVNVSMMLGGLGASQDYTAKCDLKKETESKNKL